MQNFEGQFHQSVRWLGDAGGVVTKSGSTKAPGELEKESRIDLSIASNTVYLTASKVISNCLWFLYQKMGKTVPFNFQFHIK